MASNGNRLPKIITREQAKALLKQPPTRYRCGLRNRAILELMYKGGLRSCEIRALRKADLKLPENRVDIRHSKRDRSRVVYVPDETVFWVERWLEVHKWGTPHVFCTLRGFVLSDRYLRQMVDLYAEQAGLDKQEVSPHVLRHTYATELLEDGFSIAEVQAALGHSSVQTTEVYLHVRPEELKRKMLSRKVVVDEDGLGEKGATGTAEGVKQEAETAAVVKAVSRMSEDQKRELRQALGLDA